MKEQRLSLIAGLLGWFASLAVVFFLGFAAALAMHRSPTAQTDEGLGAKEREAAALYEQLTGSSLDWAELMSIERDDRTPASLENLLKTLAGMSDANEARIVGQRFFRIVPFSKVRRLAESEPLGRLGSVPVAVVFWTLGARTGAAAEDAVVFIGEPEMKEVARAAAKAGAATAHEQE